MSLRAIVETVIHVGKFRNIDFFNQGLYFFRITLYNEKNQERYYARPYQITQTGGKNKEDQKFIIGPGRINEDLSAFCTSTMLVRYSEQEINLNEYCIFRTEIDVDEDYLDTAFHVEIELMFSDLKDLDQTPQMIKENCDNIENDATFECAHMCHYKVSRMAYGMSEYLPIITDKHFFATTGCTIHSTLIDYRFRVSAQAQNKIFGSKLLYMESGIQVKSKTLKVKKSKKKRMRKEIGGGDEEFADYDHWVPKSAAEFLFCDEMGEMAEKIDAEEADYLYNEYTNIIKGLFKKLAKTYNSFAKNVIRDKAKLNEKGIPEEAPQLIPPGYHEKVQKLKASSAPEETNEDDAPEKTVSIPKPSSEAEDSKDQPTGDSIEAEETKEISTEELKEIDLEEEKKEYSEEPILTTKKTSSENNKDKFEEEFEKLCKTSESFSKRVNLSNPGEVATKLLMEVNEYSCQLFSLWNDYIQLLMLNQTKTVEYFMPEYHKLVYERWCESIFRDVNVKTDFYHCSDSTKVGEKHLKIATKQRNSSHYQNLTPLPVEDTSMFPDWSTHPILFEECYVKDKDIFETTELKRANLELQDLVARNDRETHLIVLVHGFQGNSEDLRLLRNNLLAIYPSAVFLSSTCNESESDTNIEDQGLKLANEVSNFIDEHFKLSDIKRISFIGHSLGGVIIRAALPFLEQLKDKLYTYMSLSSPHLGYLYSPKFLVSAGMWVLKKWKKSDALKELSMSDASNMEDTYLFRLSKISKLEWFKNIVLVSSIQDSYVGFESARIQFRKSETSSKPSSAKNVIYEKMAKNLLENVPLNMIYRLDVNFKIQEKNLDSFIGRAAHIRFLENQPLMRMIVSRYSEFFA